MRLVITFIFCALLFGCSQSTSLGQGANETLPSESSLSTKGTLASKIETRVPVDEKWDSYTNTKMRFSIEIPHEFFAIFIPATNYVTIGINGEAWDIYSKGVPQKSDLDSVIKNLLGEDCYIQKTSNWKNTSVEILEVTADGDVLSGKQCKARGSAWLVLYAEELKTATFLSLGQECVFDMTCEKEDRMQNSIRLQ